MNRNIFALLFSKKYLLFLLSLVIIVAIYTVGFRRIFKKTGATAKIELPFTGAIFIILIIFLAALIITALITLITYIFFNHGQNIISWISRLKFLGIWSLTLVVSLLIVVLISQKTTYTPPILDNKGDILKGSISELDQIDVNGSKQWITIRGNDSSKPVLMFLAGGPGGTQLAATRIQLKELEKHFVVVNWDQPCSGKSYSAIPEKELTVKRYVDDGIAVTKYLTKRFKKNKVYLVGESWGSALGILLAKQSPELYYAVIGTGQMVDFLETDKYDYELGKKLAAKKGNVKLLNKLNKQGPPPYYEKNNVWKAESYLMYISNEMDKNPNISNSGYNTMSEIGGPEYGMYDKVNYFRALLSTYSQVYPQLYSVDLRKSAVKLDVPVYFFIGRYDINAPSYLVKDYYNKLQAPEKKLIWFEHSGHDAWRNETDKFVQQIMDIRVKQK